MEEKVELVEETPIRIPGIKPKRIMAPYQIFVKENFSSVYKNQAEKCI